MELKPRFVENGTIDQIWPIVEIPFYGRVALANGTALTIGMMQVEGGDNIFVGVEGKGAYIFGGWVEELYVAEKLGFLQHMSDARNLADFINRQTLGERHENYIPRGEYDPELCLKEG